jgi:hypothetical protein
MRGQAPYSVNVHCRNDWPLNGLSSLVTECQSKYPRIWVLKVLNNDWSDSQYKQRASITVFVIREHLTYLMRCLYVTVNRNSIISPVWGI